MLQGHRSSKVRVDETSMHKYSVANNGSYSRGRTERFNTIVEDWDVCPQCRMPTTQEEDGVINLERVQLLSIKVSGFMV